MDFAPILKQQRDFFLSRATQHVDFRMGALKRLASAINSRESEILDALHSDLGKGALEAYSSEIAVVQSEITFAIRHIRTWAKPKPCRSPRISWPSRMRIIPEPRGIALIIGPWNFPLQLLLSPLVGAIAAGCCAVLKPSELAPHTAAVIADLIKDAFDARHVTVVQGDREISQALLQEQFDSIFFTGSASVGREVMAAAAKHLTPVTLELGGKCPCIVCDDAPLELAARRIIWGKMMNAGQTCVAPDFVIVSSRSREPLIQAMKASLGSFYPTGPRHSTDFARIINRRHFDRLANYLDTGTLAHGGEHDADELYIAPTLLTGIPTDAPVMNEEIFGPILPIIVIDDLEDVLRFLSARPTPLSAYIFTNDSRIQQRAITEIRSGGMCINDVVVQITGKHSPFGGLGESGIGAYHGKSSFNTFTHFKSVLRCSTALDLPYRYPPVRAPMQVFRRVFRFLLKQ